MKPGLPSCYDESPGGPIKRFGDFKPEGPHTPDEYSTIFWGKGIIWQLKGDGETVSVSTIAPLPNLQVIDGQLVRLDVGA